MRIFVMRHGKTPLNQEGRINGFLEDPLSDEGRAQARAAAAQIPSSVTHIYASPLARARETAEIVNEGRNLPLIFREELKEVNFGEYNGAPYTDDMRHKHESMCYDWRPSGECVDDVKARTLQALEAIAEQHGDGEVLIVAHGGTIRMLHYLIHGEPMGYVTNASIHEFDLGKILTTLK
jgi:broad specificity phosphatase PhoE